MDNFLGVITELLDDALRRNLITPNESTRTVYTLHVIIRSGDREKLVERLDKAITRDRLGISADFEVDK